ncbi:PREDICTED: protein WVD2-like 2 [Tarenaya hassleriana]|uniref:protein WVD2-like 2 n=1 Tax=Tarenaya hassleriana TaxID=28532 RepID=UPI00053C8FD7|nr:PREDICTED: protein WVD2-like 2 [Tarenaya hassleriana]
MGREPVDKHMDKKSINRVAHSNGSSDGSKLHGFTKISEDNAEVDVVKECTEQNLVAKDAHEMQEVLDVKSRNHDERNDNVGSKKSSDDKKLSSSPPLNSRGNGNHTVPKSFALATEKRASPLSRTAGVNNNSSGNANSSNSPTASRGSQPDSPLTARKPTEHIQHHDEEDGWSVASSSATSMKTVKPKVTVGVAPTFRSTVRLERRKEFYQKLEEKHKALEAEQKENEQRLKEEQEAAIKQLRKSMAYRANPVPSFYYEGPPPKVELKKLPLTRPKSPNLNRRKSCSDAANSQCKEEEKGKHCARHRHSVDGCKEEPKSTNSPRTAKINGNHPRKSTKGTPKTATARAVEDSREKITGEITRAVSGETSVENGETVA